jgi:hypothetical protein
MNRKTLSVITLSKVVNEVPSVIRNMKPFKALLDDKPKWVTVKLPLIPSLKIPPLAVNEWTFSFLQLLWRNVISGSGTQLFCICQAKVNDYWISIRIFKKNVV